MELLTSLFRQLLSMSLTALPVMAVVLLARGLLGRAPKRYRYGLWFVVWFHLVWPLAFPVRPWSIFSLAPFRRVSEAAQAVSGGAAPGGTVTAPPAAAVPMTPAAPGSGAVPAAGVPVEPGLSAGELALRIAAVVWLAGAAALVLYGVISTVRLRRRVAAAVWQGGEVWECDSIPTPFVLGLVRPRIYIPFRLTDNERTYVLAHERYHIRWRDHWAKLLAYGILAAYWWNPAVWLCWALFCRDMEMRCDEAVLDQLGDQVKTGYSLTLVSFALDRRAPVTLAFGEHDASRRVKNVLAWKRATPRAAFLAVALVLLAAMVCISDPAPRGSWVEIRNNDFGVAYTWELESPIRSWALYEDVYLNGQLTSSRACVVLDDFQEDGGASSRHASGTLRITESNGEDGGAIRCILEGAAAAGWEVLLPEQASMRGLVPGDGSVLLTGKKLRYDLEPGGDAVLCSVVFAEGETGSATAYHRDLGLVGSNDMVVQYRLATSMEPAASFEPLESGDLAQTLFALRVASREDGDGIRALVTALGGDDLGSYSLVWYEQAVEFAFSEPLSEWQVSEMWFTSQLLLALVENADQINYSFPAEDSHITYYCDQEQADGWAQALGYGGIKDLGRSEAGIRALLAYLGMDGKASSSVTHTAQQMYELAQDDTPDALVDDLLCWDLWGDPSVEGTYIQTVQDGTLELVFQDTALWEEAMLDSGYMARNGCLILALRPELNTVWAGDTDKTSYTKVTRESAARILPEGRTVGDYGASPEALMELIALLEDPDIFTGRSIQKRADYQITLDPARWQLTEAQNNDTWQFAGEPKVGIEIFTMDPGTKPERLARTYRSWNRSCVAAANLPLPEESPFLWALTAEMADGGHQEVYMTDQGDQAWHLVILNWDDGHGDLLQELREIAATFAEVDAETDTLYTAKPFTDILGYDGFISVESSNQIDWSNRTYYAVTGEETFPIAESFGWGDPQDYAVDLDGDGQEELVCNVTYGADGARRVSIYQRRGDEIWRSWVTADGLPGYERDGVGSSYEEYDPVENVFRIHYRKAGQEDYAVAEVRGMAQLEEWYPYP